MERQLIDLGWAIAIIQPAEPHEYCKLMIMAPASEEENVGLMPAQSIEIFGLNNVVKLRDALGKYIEQKGEAT